MKFWKEFNISLKFKNYLNDYLNDIISIQDVLIKFSENPNIAYCFKFSEVNDSKGGLFEKDKAEQIYEKSGNTMVSKGKAALTLLSDNIITYTLNGKGDGISVAYSSSKSCTDQNPNDNRWGSDDPTTGDKIYQSKLLSIILHINNIMQTFYVSFNYALAALLNFLSCLIKPLSLTLTGVTTPLSFLPATLISRAKIAKRS